MALLKISDELSADEQVFNAIIRSFDEVREVGYDPLYRVSTLRVISEEVPKEDVLLDVALYKFAGIEPFIIDYGV